MASLAQQILKALIKSDLVPKRTAIPDTDDEPGFFMGLISNRVCAFDIESIDSLDDYKGLVQQLADATLGEWLPEKVEITPRKGDKVDLNFLLNKESVRINFIHEPGDYLSFEFIDKVLRHISRVCGGRFLPLTTEDSFICQVYLPKDCYKKIHTLRKKTLNIDALVDHYRQGKEFTTKHFDCLQLMNKHDLKGDTPLTAALKNRNERGVNQLFDNLGSSPFMPDQEGHTPFFLAVQYENKRFIEFFSKWTHVAQGREAVVSELESQIQRYGDNIGAKAGLILKLLEELPIDIQLYVKIEAFTIHFGRTPTFVAGHDHIHIEHAESDPQRYYCSYIRPELDIHHYGEWIDLPTMVAFITDLYRIDSNSMLPEY